MVLHKTEDRNLEQSRAKKNKTKKKHCTHTKHPQISESESEKQPYLDTSI